MNRSSQKPFHVLSMEVGVMETRGDGNQRRFFNNLQLVLLATFYIIVKGNSNP